MFFENKNLLWGMLQDLGGRGVDVPFGRRHCRVEHRAHEERLEGRPCQVERFTEEGYEVGQISADEVDEEAQEQLQVGIGRDRVLNDCDGGRAWPDVVEQAEEDVIIHGLRSRNGNRNDILHQVVDIRIHLCCQSSRHFRKRL